MKNIFLKKIKELKIKIWYSWEIKNLINFFFFFYRHTLIV